ncbi:MAG: CDP-alcohol phosphatidyltransferase family protein [Candidatus Aminicenantaceae bacterium]
MNKNRAERIFSIPNLFSLSRVLLVPVFLYAVINGRTQMAFIIFLVSATTDFLDGASARLLNQKTKLGALLDPICDKVFMTGAYITLTIPFLNSPNVLPLWLTAIVIGRDVLIVGGAIVLYLLIQAKSFPPTLTGKTSTVWQFSSLLLVLLFNMLGKEAGFLFWFYIVAGILTIISGYEYVQRGCEWLRSSRKKG